MRHRPWEIVVLAVLYLLAPVTNVLQAAIFNNIPVFGEYGVLANLSVRGWLIHLSYPLIALAIYSVRKSGWWITIGFSVVLIVYNFYVMSINQNYHLLVALAFNVAIAAGAGVIMGKHVRAPYFNPRLRWWETDPRVKAPSSEEIPVTIKAGDRVLTASLADFSSQGCFIQMNVMLELKQEIELRIEYFDQVIVREGQVVRLQLPDEGKNGFGIRFTKSDKNLEFATMRFFFALKAHGAKNRNEANEASA